MDRQLSLFKYIINTSIKRVARDKPDEPPATYLYRQSAKACMMGTTKF